MSSAAEEVGTDNFFAQESKLDLANVCAEKDAGATGIEMGEQISDDGDEFGIGMEDPALVEKVRCGFKNL